MTAAPKLTKRQKAYVLTLAETRSLGAALKAAGCSSLAIQRERNTNPYFDQCASAAERVALNDAAFVRAVEGVEVPKFWEGEQVGTVTEYSDTLLLALLKAKGGPEY